MTQPKTLNINNYHVASVSNKVFDLYKGDPYYSCVKIGDVTHYYDIDSSFSDRQEFIDMVESRFNMKFNDVFETTKGCWWVK